ncbi:MAG TPA: VWA domain-containing protein [Thermoanaerobaculia bacterium]|nr:VWA domain-containing protein [Thermoanaerobaculia bacterium]
MSRYPSILALALLAILTGPAGAALAQGPAPVAQAPPAVAQQPPAEPTGPVGEFAGTAHVAWVLVPVVVRRPGGYVTDLERSDFRLWIDGERVTPADFEAGGDAPLSLVLLQDLSGSMANGGKLEASRRALAYVLGQARAGDELALATFAGGRLSVDVPFTTDTGVLAEAMALWEGYGTTALHDAVSRIPEIGEAARRGKRAVVLVTDGVDNASTVAPEAARAMVRQSSVPVYVLGLGRDRIGSVSTPEQAPAATWGHLLRRLASETGGRYYPVRHPRDIESAVADLVRELRSQYVLFFPTAPGPRVPRSVRVDVDVAGRAEVYHRPGYVGGPPTAARSTTEQGGP